MKVSNIDIIDSIIDQFKGKDGILIPLLQEVQNKLGYLSNDTVRHIAERTQITPAEIYGVITFYTQFRTKPIGENIVRVCHGTACHVAGAPGISEAIYDELDIGKNGTTDDLKFTVEEVACLGCCSLAPAMMINDKTYGRLTPDKVRKIISNY
ncbi:MAG: NADH-quinone oxidoreductase subunit NuoE [Candidatus Cloacimonetes bacterium]|nr:NADH-quinone oxidoreductase subunit NuoE [Candidatus Cloacimonadota bacterium]MBS3766661.1 NADH-quinone oxidoreductase subunit NuoE [Candidatus Cloacimonadota bacterium]